MPTFYGRSTSVQLSVANLARATTQNPQSRQCSASTSGIKQIDLEFAKASRDGTLAETALLGEDGRHLRFLGKHEDLPFFMVRAGKDFFDPDTMEKTTRRPAKSVKAQTSDNIALYDSGLDEVEEATVSSRSMAVDTNEQQRHLTEPHALCLTVFLSKTSFSQTVYKDGMKMDVKHDIKVDVYFNGQFFDSQIMGIGQLHHTGPRGIKVRMHRFTGQKLSRFIEKPWIFVPPDRQPDGCPRAHSPMNDSTSKSRADLVENRRASVPMNASTSVAVGHQSDGSLRASSPMNASIPENLRADAGANRRWTTIAKGLLKEADKAGRDKHGERPITGDYLASLASLPAPPELKNKQKAGSASFGVIDVVVVYGKGQKDAADSKYLTGPTPLRLKGYSTETNVGTGNVNVQIPNKGDETAAPNHNIVDITPQVKANVATLQLDAIPTATPIPQASPAPKTRAEALATALTLDGSGDEPPKPVSATPNGLYPTSQNRQGTFSTSTTRQTSLLSTRRTTPKRSRETSISSETSNPLKRQRMPYYHIITAKQTYAEEMESIVEQAVEEAETLTTKRALTNNEAATGMVNNSPSSSDLEEVSLVETPSTASKINTLKISPPKLTSSPVKAGISSKRDAFTTPRQHEAISSNLSPLGGSAPAGTAPPSSHSRSWTTKSDVAHSFDAGFVMPELSEDCCVTFAERGVVRSVGAIRGGWFEEKGVIMGTRFIVG